MAARPLAQRACRSLGPALGVCAGLLALSMARDREPENTRPCPVHDAAAQIFEGSRLFDAPNERLELSRGRALACDHPEARRVLAALELALVDFPRERLVGPVRVHLDPRLPLRQAPLAPIEVHVTTRELLAAEATLDELPPEAWRHELFHSLAAPLPAMSREARHLWLTLEEGVVEYVTARSTRTRGASHEPKPASTTAALLPLDEWLASAAYDPHPLAAGLARALEAVEPPADDEAWLDCLSAHPGSVGGTLAPSPQMHSGLLGANVSSEWAKVWHGFMDRCSAGAARHAAAAFGRWWSAPPQAAAPSKAAARELESR